MNESEFGHEWHNLRCFKLCNPVNLSNFELLEFPDIVLIQYNLIIFRIGIWQQFAGNIRWSFRSSMQRYNKTYTSWVYDAAMHRKANKIKGYTHR